MANEWRVTQKPDFFKALLALPPKETRQVLEKISLLVQDPTPDAKVKKQLKYHERQASSYPQRRLSHLLYLRAALHQHPCFAPTR